MTDLRKGVFVVLSRFASRAGIYWTYCAARRAYFASKTRAAENRACAARYVKSQLPTARRRESDEILIATRISFRNRPRNGCRRARRYAALPFVSRRIDKTDTDTRAYTPPTFRHEWDTCTRSNTPIASNASQTRNATRRSRQETNPCLTTHPNPHRAAISSAWPLPRSLRAR